MSIATTVSTRMGLMMRIRTWFSLRHRVSPKWTEVDYTYRRLDADKIIDTAGILEGRVRGRFPGSGLSQVCCELERVTREAEGTVALLAAPHIHIRCIVAAGITFLLGFIGLIIAQAASVWAPWSGMPWADPNLVADLSNTLQGVEAGINDLVFVGVAVWFLMQIEVRWKRSLALNSLRSLRALAHIIDMHQLTKDAERIVVSSPGVRTTRQMSSEDLTRYLDYCSDALALIGKVAAMHVQEFDDAETLAAVGEIEDLTASLAQTIWQKITILDRIVHDGSPTPNFPPVSN